MASVTAARSTLIDPVDYEQPRVISNAGPDPVEVSTDKHFTYGYGVRIESGQSSGVVLHKGEALYARCAAAGTATVTVDAAPADPSVPPSSGSSAQVFEVTDLLIPAGTDWSENGHVIGTTAGEVDPQSGLLIAVWIEVAPDYPTTVTDSINVAVVGATMGRVAAVAASGDSGTRFAGGGGETGIPTLLVPSAFSPDAVPEALTIQLDGYGATTADITVVRARAAILTV